MSVALPYDPGMPGWDQESRLVKRGFPGCLNHTDRAAELHKCSHRFLSSLSVDCFGLGGMYLLLTRIHLSLTWPNALGLGYHCRVAVAMLMHDKNLVLPTISHLNFDNGELVFVFTSPVLVTITTWYSVLYKWEAVIIPMTQSLRQVHGQWCVQNFAQGNERYQIMIRVVSGQQSSDNIAFESQSGLATKAPSEPTPGRPRLNLSLKFSFTQVYIIIVPASRRYVQYVQRFGTVAVFIPLERFLTRNTMGIFGKSGGELEHVDRQVWNGTVQFQL